MDKPGSRDWARAENPFTILLDRDKFMSMFGKCNIPSSDGKPNARVPKLRKKVFANSHYEGLTDED